MSMEHCCTRWAWGWGSSLPWWWSFTAAFAETKWAPCKCELWIIIRLFYLQFMKLRYITSICYRHCYYLSKVYKTSFPVTKIMTWDPLGNHRQKLARVAAQRSLYAIKTIQIRMKPPSDCFLFKWWWAASSFISFFFFFCICQMRFGSAFKVKAVQERSQSEDHTFALEPFCGTPKP